MLGTSSNLLVDVRRKQSLSSTFVFISTFIPVVIVITNIIIVVTIVMITIIIDFILEELGE